MNANTNTPKTARQQFAEAMVAAGYHNPEMGHDQFLYERDEDRFVGWTLTALAAPQPEATSTEATAMQGLADDHALFAATVKDSWPMDRRDGQRHDEYASGYTQMCFAYFRAGMRAAHAQHAAQAPTAVRASEVSGEQIWHTARGSYESSMAGSAPGWKLFGELSSYDKAEWIARATLATAAVQGDASSVQNDYEQPAGTCTQEFADSMELVKDGLTVAELRAVSPSERHIVLAALEFVLKWARTTHIATPAPAAPGPAASSAVPHRMVCQFPNACPKDGPSGCSCPLEPISEGAAASPALAPEQSHD